MDLQACRMITGTARNGITYATFYERGEPSVTGFGRVADILIERRYADGVAIIEQNGSIKMIAVYPNASSQLLVDEHGDCARLAA